MRKDGPPLIKRDWLSKIKLYWTTFNVMKVDTKNMLCDLLERHELFQNELGYIKGEEAQLHFKVESSSKFLKARNMPFAFKPSV